MTLEMDGTPRAGEPQNAHPPTYPSLTTHTHPSEHMSIWLYGTKSCSPCPGLSLLCMLYDVNKPGCEYTGAEGKLGREEQGWVAAWLCFEPATSRLSPYV